MNTHIKKFSALIGTLIFAFGSSFAQDKEYDDLYFMPSDRNTVKKVKVDNKVVQDANQVQQLTTDPQENYSSKTVNPEYVARYQAKSQEDYTSDSEYSGDEYYDENYDNYSNVNDYQRDADVVVRDRYGNTTYFRDYSDVYWSDPSFYRGSAFDPFYSPYRFNRLRPFRSGWSVSFGFGNTWGWRNGWYSGVSVGYGWGSGWGNGWGGFYDPFYDPFYSFYDPFYCPPYFNSYYGYGNPYRNVVVVNNYETRSNRTIKRGPSTSRSGNLANNGRSGRTNTSSGGDISNGRTTNGRVATEATSRDYSDTQSRYYRRSREAVSSSPSNDNVSNGRTYSSRSRSTSNYSTESRNVNRSTRSSSSYDRSSGNNNSNYNRSRSTNTNRSNYNSTPTRSRSNNSGYNNNSRSNSRSSGYSSGSGSNSRSSGTSSYSSGSNSRSSGSSGRSSSGSSSRSRRGGN